MVIKISCWLSGCPTFLRLFIPLFLLQHLASISSNLPSLEHETPTYEGSVHSIVFAPLSYVVIDVVLTVWVLRIHS